MKTCSHAMRVILLASVLVAATALLLLVSSPPAQADGVVYVSNMGVLDGQSIEVTTISYAQAFQTGGASTDTFALGSIELNISELLANFDVDGVQVRLYSSTASSGPNAEICTLSNPSDWDTTGVKRFGTVAACSRLDGDTTYFVVMDYTSTGLGYKLQYANSGSEDSGAATGWGINDTHWSKISGASWLAAAFNADHVIKIRVRAANTSPTASDGTVDTYEGTAYTFKAGDFGFQDADNSDSDANNDDTLNHVKITSLPDTGEGTLWLDANDDDNLGDSEAVSVGDAVAAGDIDGGKLQYTPPASGTGKAFTSFKFKVNDGLDDSVGEVTMSINVSVAFVSNLAQQTGNDNYDVNTREFPRAGGFTTADNPKSYDLGSFKLELRGFGHEPTWNTTTVKLYSGASNKPATALCTLVNPDVTVADPTEGEDGQFTFAAPADCPTMAKDTEYFVVVDTVETPGQANATTLWDVTDSPDEDSTSLENWSISNRSLYYDINATPPQWKVGEGSYAFQFKVNGAAILNALPTADDNAEVTTDEDTTYTFAEAYFSLSDTDAADTLYVVITSLPDAGTLWFDVDGADDQMGNNEAVSLNDKVVEADLGKLKYTPPANAHNANGDPFTTFNFKVNDGYEDSASGYTMTVNVTAVNDAPMLTSGPMTASLAENTDVDANPLATYTATDVEGDTIMWLLGETESGRDDSNEFSIVGGRLYFVSPRDFENPKDRSPEDNVYEFRVIPYDGIILGMGRDVAVTVTNVNEPPVAVDDTAKTDEDTSVDIDAVANDTDVDANTTLTVTDVGTANSGSASITGDGTTITYTPNTGFLGIDTFTYTVSDDGDPVMTDTGTVTVSVAPTVSGSTAISYAENSTDPVETYTANGSPTWSLSGADSGDFTISNAADDTNGELSLVSPPDFENPSGIVYNATVEATVGTGDDAVTGTLPVTVTVTDVNEAPVATDDVVTTDEDTAAVISVLGNDTDEDANTTLSVSAVGTADGVNTPTETNPANGTVVITAGSTTTITYTPSPDSTVDDTFTYIVSDGADPALTAIGTVTVAVTAVNDAPVAVNDYAFTDEVEAVDVDVVGNDTDVEMDTLSVTGVSTPNNGMATIKLGSTTEVTYTPDADFAGFDTFTYTVADGSGDDALTDTGTVTVSVAPTVSGSTAISYAENSTDPVETYTANGSPTWSLSGADSGDFTISNAADDTNGELSLVSPPDFENPSGIVYNATVEATVGTGDDAVTGTLPVTVTVTDVNEAPVATDDVVTTDEDTAAVISVLGNDTDEDANTTLSVSAVGTADGVNTPTETNPANGTVVITAGSTTTITYTPSPDSTVDDTFTYIVSDGADPALTAIGTVTVAVTAVNDAPVAVNDYAFTDEVEAVDVDVVGNDTDVEMDTLSVTGVSTPNNGMATIKLGSTTEVTYTPDADFAGFDTFTYTVADGSGDDALTDTGTVTVSVAPTVSGSTAISYAENSTDPVETYTASGSPTWRLTGTDRDAFSIGSTTGVLTFKNSPDFESPADANTDNVYVVTVVATVQSGGSTVTVTKMVTVTVIGVNEPLTVTGSAQEDYAENATVTVSTYSASGSGGTISWSLSGADSGEFKISAGVLAFVSPPDFDNPTDGGDQGGEGDRNNVYEVTVEASEGTGVNKVTVTLDVAVTVTDLPVVSGPAVSEYPENGTVAVGTYSASGSSGTISWSLELIGDYEDFSIDRATGELTFDSTDFPNGPDYESAADANIDNVYDVTVRATGGTEFSTLAVTVEVVDVNDAVLTVADDAATTDEDTEVVISVLDNDRLAATSTNALSVSGVGTGADGPSNGTAAVSQGSTTTITYSPNDDFYGEDSFTYTATDGTNTATGTVRVTVTQVNDAPTAVNDTVVTVAGTAIVIDVVANDTDADLDPLSVVSVGGVSEGTAALTARSSTEITYTPIADFSGDDSFSYTVTDGTATDTGMVSVTVEKIAEVDIEDLVDLSNLIVSSGTGDGTVGLNEEFAEETTAYTLDVRNSVGSLEVTPIKKFVDSDNVAVEIRVNGTEVDSGSSIPVRAGGVTTIQVKVIAEITPEGGVVTQISQTYTIRVTRPARPTSSNANLAELTVSGGALDVDFDSGITDYTMTVDNSVASISLDLVTAHGSATVVVTANGVEAPADNIPLTEGGSTVITVVVTAQDGRTTKTYTIRVSRAPSANADLAGLTVSEGSLDSDFEPGTTSYSVAVANSVSSVSVFPRAANANATVTVKVNGVEAPGDNIPLTEGGTTVVTLLVTAQDGTTTRTYTIRVTRAPSSLSANADLAGLTISEGSLNTDFEPGITSYSVAVANSVSSVSVFPRAANANATVTVKVNGVEVPADNIPLTEGGTTVVTLLVTAQDGSTSKTYTITVFRAARVSVGRGGGGGSVSRNLTPSFVEGSQTIRSVAENTPGGANIGAPIVATGSTGDRLSYALLGADAPLFDIDAAAGQLLTNGPLDFESKSGYRVSVSVSNSRGGRDTIAVTINLTNVDEPGTVAVLPAQPTVGRAMTAVLTDPDGGVTGITWQWAVSSDQVVWLDIPGATSVTYSPVADDGGKYLRAMAFYTDGEGTGKSAQATWDTPLAAPPAPASTMTPEPTGAGPSSERTRAASPATMTTPAPTPTAAPTTPTAIPSAAVVPTPAPAAGVPATSALEQAADDSGIDLWVILLIAAVVAAVAVGLLILGVRIIRA